MLIWEEVKCEKMEKSFLEGAMNPMLRAKVPGGWFIRIALLNVDSAFFYSDPEHIWDGSSLP